MKFVATALFATIITRQEDCNQLGVSVMCAQASQS
jgi:hypothetical protein